MARRKLGGFSLYYIRKKLTKLTHVSLGALLNQTVMGSVQGNVKKQKDRVERGERELPFVFFLSLFSQWVEKSKFRN